MTAVELQAAARHVATLAPERTIDDWDWPTIRRAETQAGRRGAKLARCDRCGRPMWCGQRDTHHVCGDAA